jgi:hypothetical protein
MSGEDGFYATYKYAWCEQADGTLQDFLTKVSLIFKLPVVRSYYY